MADKEFLVGIVGLGGMGNWHREIIEVIDGINVAGIYDISEDRNQFARESNLRVYESLDEILADQSIDIILIATPNDVHKEIAVKAMEAGKNVVCEKPVTLNSKELEEIIEVSNKTGKFFTVHQNRRWDEDFLTIKEIHEKGSLGNIFRIESRVHGSRGIPGDWRGEKEFGGGMVLDWGVHLFDQILLMMGDTKLKKVYASLDNVTNQIVDDGFRAILTFENELEVLVEVGTSNFISLPRWYVLGENGTAVIKDWDLSGEMILASGINETDVVPVKTAAGLTKTMAPRREDTIHVEKLPVVHSDIRDFYKNVMAVLSGKEESKIKLSEIMRVMKLMETVFEAANLGQVVDFE